MEPLAVPKTVKVYQLIKMSTKSSLHFGSTGATGATGAGYIGSGFYITQADAEQNRIMETLRDTDGAKFFVFELEFPNPIFKE
jgi:hypothetical protein